MPMARKNWIDTEVNLEGSIPEVRRGVKFGLGDGTVPLVSLGAMCVKGWKDDRWNPARMPIITHEFNHEPEGMDLRGGARSGKFPGYCSLRICADLRLALFAAADHIDILGNHQLNSVIMRIGKQIRSTF